jgi:hypothetical protein
LKDCRKSIRTKSCDVPSETEQTKTVEIGCKSNDFIQEEEEEEEREEDNPNNEEHKIEIKMMNKLE